MIKIVTIAMVMIRVVDLHCLLFALEKSDSRSGVLTSDEFFDEDS